MALASGSPVGAEVLHPLSPRNPPAPTGKTRVTATIPARFERRLREIAEMEDTTLAEVVRVAIRTYLNHKDKESPQ